MNRFNAFNVLNSWTNTTMAAEDSLLFISDYSSKWHLLKDLINLCKDTIWIINIFSKSLGALITKSEVSVDMLVLMVTSEKHDLLWELQLQRHQQADDFKTVLTLVNIIS